MTETAGPHTGYYFNKPQTDINLSSAGMVLDGAETNIFNPNSEGMGEICMKGRNRFMGYFKDENATLRAIDEKGFLHSGDLGFIDKESIIYITGRIKELIITAGGENIAPILIENEIKN